MARYLSFAYGVLTYLFFLVVFLYAVAFVGDLAVVPKTIDGGGPQAPTATALVVNLALLGLFAVQHSVMARQWFKKRWTKIVPWHIERSTYVLVATAVLALVMWQWRPMPEVVWSVESAVLAGVLGGVFWAGWALVFAAATTGYILVAIQFEEQDLTRFHGEAYARYRERVAMLIPRPGRTADDLEPPPGSDAPAPERGRR